MDDDRKTLKCRICPFTVPLWTRRVGSKSKSGHDRMVDHAIKVHGPEGDGLLTEQLRETRPEEIAEAEEAVKESAERVRKFNQAAKGVP